MQLALIHCLVGESEERELGPLINGVVRRLIRASWREIRGTKGIWEQQRERWGHSRGQRANNELAG